MPKVTLQDPEFDIRFFESVLRRLPQDTGLLEILGGLYTRQGRIADGLRMDRRLVRLCPGNATARYNLACSLALAQRPRAALRELRQAVGLGYRDFDWMHQDPDLDGLKELADFKSLVRESKARL